MTRRPPNNIAASVRQRLLMKARETGRPFSELLQYFAMERFLYRLCKSRYADNFVLKGALMLTVWEAPLTRPTMDIDLLGRIENSIETIVEVTREICHQEVVRWMASEARLALAYATGAGAGFIEALLAFDRSTAQLPVYRQRGMSPLDPDDGLESNIPLNPERWFGLLCAGVVCSGPDLLAHLKIWLDASTRLLGEEAALTNNIRLLLKGSSLPFELLHPAVIDTASPSPMRCGAAAQLLKGMPAEKTLQIQSFLTSGFVSDESFGRQSLFNRHVARLFVDSWRTHAQNPFQFYSPRKSVPALLGTLDGVEHGSGTLKSVLVAAASALRQPLGEFLERVL